MPLQAISSDVTTATMETTGNTPSVALANLTIPSGVGISVTGTVTGAAHTTGDIFVASFAALVVNVGEGAEIRGMSIAPLHSTGTDADNWTFSVGVEAGQPEITLDVTGDDKVIDWCASYEMVQVTDEFDVVPDYTPDAIVFVNAVDVLKGAEVTSNTVTITGIDDGTSFLIAGGVAVIDGVEAGDNGIINNGQTLALRTTSSTNNAVETIVNWAVGTESGVWSLRTASVEMPRNSNVHYGIDVNWQGPAESEVDIFVRDFASIQDAVTAIKNLADSEGVVRTYTLGLEPDTVYREEVSLNRVRFPNDSTLKITTVNGTPDTMATISGADILSGLVPCDESDQARVGDRYTDILKVNVPSPAFNPNTMNLHEDGERLDLVTDRAQEPDLTLFTFDPTDWHTATAKSVDGDNHINGYTSPIIAGYSAEQLLAAQVLIYGSSNRTTLAPIDSVSGDTINFTSDFVPNDDKGTNPLRNNFALLNILPKLSDTDLPTGRWGYFDEGDGTVTVYILPRNQADSDERCEYSVRNLCIDTADFNRLVIEGINAYQTGGTINQNAICLGTRSDRIKAVADRRDNLVIRNVRAGKKGLTAGTNYGAISVSSVNKLIVENCHVFDVPYGPGIGNFSSSNVTIRNNLIERAETTPISCFGGGTSDGVVKAGGFSENLQILNNYIYQCGREVHANKFTAYEQCNYVMFAGNVYDDCYGYFTWQECSNIVIAWNLLPDGNRNDSTVANRAIADQQNRTPEPDPSGFSILYNNQSTPNPLTLSDGGNWQLFAANGTQTTSVYNNIMTGLSRLAGYPTYFGSAAHNIIALDGINLDSTDINIPDYSTLYRDAAGEDFSFVDGGVINNIGFDMRPVIQNILDAWANGPIQGDSANIGHPIDRAILETDRNGNLVNWDQPFIGSYNPSLNPDIISFSFGANTLAMHGGVAVNGSVIMSGDDGGEFTIVDGYLMPVSDGFTASDYTLTLDSGDELNIRVETDAYSVRGQAEFDALIAGAVDLSGNKIILRDAVDTLSIQNKAYSAPLSIMQETGTVRSVFVNSVNNLTFDGINFADSNLNNRDAAISSNSPIIIRASDQVTFHSCTVNNESANGPSTYLTGVRCENSTALEFNNCEVSHVYNAFVVENGDVTFNRCVVHDIFRDGFSTLRSDVVLEDSEAYNFYATPGRRFVGTITGTLDTNEYLSTGPLPENPARVRGGEVRAVGADTVDIFYNGHERPNVGDVLSGQNGTFTVTGFGTDIGIHGDCFQPLNNGAVRDHTIVCRRNFFHIGTPLTSGALGTYQAPQGIFIQANDVSFGWSNVIVENNCIATEHSRAITVSGAKGGTVQHNTILMDDVQLFQSRLRYGKSQGLIIRGNVSDFGPIDEGGSSNIDLVGNVDVRLSDYGSNYINTPIGAPYSKDSFRPIVGSTIDIANAGAVDANGKFRQAVQSGAPALVITETGIALPGSDIALTIGADGSADQMLVVAIEVEDTDGTLADVSSAMWGPVSLTPVQNLVGGSLNRGVLFYAPIGSSKGSYDVSITLSNLSDRGAVIGAAIFSGIKQQAPVLNPVADPVTFSGDVTLPNSALAFAVAFNASLSEPDMSATEGMTTFSIEDDTASASLAFAHRIEPAGTYSLGFSASTIARQRFAIGYFEAVKQPISLAFGANTLAGQGGVPANGTMITAGDTLGEFTITNGFLVPTGDGFTTSDYTLTLDSGDELNIIIEADTYSIRTLDQAAQAAKHAIAPGSDPTKAATIKFRDANYQGDLNIAALPGRGDMTKTGVITDPDRLYYTADSDGFPLSVVGHENAVASFDGGYLKLVSETSTPQELVGRTRLSGIGSLWLENLAFLNETPRDGFAYEPEKDVEIESIVSVGNPTIVTVDETKELTPNALVNITGASGFDQLNASGVRIIEINGNTVSFDLDTTGLTPSYVTGSASFLGARDNANHETDSLLIDVGTVSPEPARVLMQNCKSCAVDITNNARYPNGFRISSAETVAIEDCELDGFYNGISIGNCQDVTVRRNSLRRQISDGIRVFTSDGLSGENANVSVTHNTIFDPILDISHGARHNDGIQMGTHNDTIGYDIFEAYNYVYLPGAQCLYHDDFPSPLKMRGVITNNLCLGSAGNGIRVWRNDDHFVQVVNNTMIRATEFTSDTSANIEPAIINAEAGRALFDNNIVAQINTSEGDFVTNTVDIDHFDENGMSAYSTVFTGPFGFDTSLGHTYTIDTTNADTVRQSLDDVFQGNSGFETAGHNAPPIVLARPAPVPATPEDAIFNLADISDINRIINTNSENYFPDNMTKFTVVMRVAADFTLGQEFLSAGSSTRIVGFVAATGLRFTIGGERFQTTAFPDDGQLTTIILSADLTRPVETDRYQVFFDYNNGERRLVNVTDTGQTIDLTEFHASNWANLSLFSNTSGANPVPVLLDYIGLYNTAFDLGNVAEQIKFLPQNMPVDGVIDGHMPLVFITGDAAIGNDAGLVVNSGSLSDFTRTGDIAAYSAPVYQERLTRFEQTTDILTRAAPLQLGGADVTNSPYGLLFFSLDLTGLPLDRGERFFGAGNNFYILIHQDGNFSLRAVDVDGNRNINHRTTNVFNLTRINGFITMDNINGSRIYIEGLDAMGMPTIENVVEIANGSPFRFDYNSFALGSDDLAFDFARLALWRLDQTPPDVTDAVVRAQFYNDVSKITVDPQLSINLLGAPILDIYGSAGEVNQGLDQSGNGNNFTIDGAVTDV